MSDQELPVSVAVRRPDGSVENVRVGTAVRSGEGYVLKLELLLGAEGTARAAAAPRSAAHAASSSSAGPTGPGPGIFPPYGRSKGLPIAGASRGDLEFYASGSRRTLSDPAKARFHDKERALLAAIEAELARQGGGSDTRGGATTSRRPPTTATDRPATISPVKTTR